MRRRLDPGEVAVAIARSGGVPGRLERVDAGQDFLVVVDYAHKPDAVEAAIGTLRPLAETAGGRVLVVLGAGGERDPGKRPIMAESAARLADLLVVTDDNPRSEDPAAIRAAMLAGVVSGEVVEGNPAIADDPSVINRDPEGEGWFFKLKLADTSELEGLMTEADYREYCDSL